MSEPQKRMNILLIVSDQLAWRALPAYGNTTVRTPHIDRIVKSGVRFENCYCTIPLCQPSRASFWTGRFSHQTGVLSNGKFFPDPPIPENMATLGQLFSKAGYKTIHFGKTHAAGALEGFEVEPVKELPVPEEPAWPLNYDTRQDRYTTTRAVQFLAGDHPKPFLCVVDLNNPHNICDWIGANRGPNEDMPVATFESMTSPHGRAPSNIFAAPTIVSLKLRDGRRRTIGIISRHMTITSRAWIPRSALSLMRSPSRVKLKIR
jgi:choline-sulfatase